MNNNYQKCIQCRKIATTCPHRNASLPTDGTICPMGYAVEKRTSAIGSQRQKKPASVSSQKRVKRAIWSEEKNKKWLH